MYSAKPSPAYINQTPNFGFLNDFSTDVAHDGKDLIAFIAQHLFIGEKAINDDAVSHFTCITS
jgi:hypothetical protein